MDKNVEIGLLLDFYGNFLTERQREIIGLYYEENLTFTEIAENLEISKQAVSDAIKRSEKILYEIFLPSDRENLILYPSFILLYLFHSS